MASLKTSYKMFNNPDMENTSTAGIQEWTILTAAECLLMFDEVQGRIQNTSPGTCTSI